MATKLYNTLGRRIVDFRPLSPGKVKLYSCGPTVYDYAHLGNLRTFVFYDILHRSLKAQGLTVEHVMNITDVGHLTGDNDEGDDKLEKGAERQGKSVLEVAQFYTDAFMEDMKQLNNLEPRYAKATDFIAAQIDIVSRLLEKGFAYQTEQAIYFDVTKLGSYGELTGQKLKDKEIAVRQEVVSDKNKRHPYDFAVWFFTVGHFSDHSLRWPSPWGKGFPGWHLECSAIIHQTLGDPIDIHAAGVDLIGTHNINEAAQTEAAFGHKLASYWVHSEHLLVDDQRMAKSGSNFFTLADLRDKGYEPMALRLLFLGSHYRSQQNFTFDSLDAAASRLMTYRGFADRRFQAVDHSSEVDFLKTRQEIKRLLADDLATPKVLALIDNLIDATSGQPPPAYHLDEFHNLLKDIDDYLGLDWLSSDDISEEERQLIAKRESARQAGDWAAADKIRQKLADMNLEINDTPTGPVWIRS